MRLQVNLRHLAAHSVILEGDLPVADLDIEIRDETIKLKDPLQYCLEAQKLEHNLLVQGRLSLKLDCQCVRCLKHFPYRVSLERWALHLPLQGDEAVPVVSDCVDLTPMVREDILLAFPQHPLCEADCRGLPGAGSAQSGHIGPAGHAQAESSAWAELNKLKF
jgi:uncharacterized protein